MWPGSRAKAKAAFCCNPGEKNAFKQINSPLNESKALPAHSALKGILALKLDRRPFVSKERVRPHWVREQLSLHTCLSVSDGPA